jgi:hypothetical protein
MLDFRTFRATAVIRAHPRPSAPIRGIRVYLLGRYPEAMRVAVMVAPGGKQAEFETAYAEYPISDEASLA